MARNSRRKQPGMIRNFLLEASALAGVLGISQPALRDQLWSLITQRSGTHATVWAPLNASGEVPSMTYAPLQPPPEQPGSQQQMLQQGYLPEPLLSSAPSAYTAQMNSPANPTSRAAGRNANFNPMGSYQ